MAPTCASRLTLKKLWSVCSNSFSIQVAVIRQPQIAAMFTAPTTALLRLPQASLRQYALSAATNTVTPVRTLRLTSGITSSQRRLKSCQSAPKTLCSSKAATTPPLTASHFWTSAPTWKRAGINTLRCLVGCTVGDFSAMWYLQAFHASTGMETIMAISSKSLWLTFYAY